MNAFQYDQFVRLMAAEHALSSNLKRRRSMEQTYFLHHKKQGTKLRAKYRMA
jgi:hypothetical protein